MENLEACLREHGYLLVELRFPTFIFFMGQRLIKVVYEKKLNNLVKIWCFKKICANKFYPYWQGFCMVECVCESAITLVVKDVSERGGLIPRQAYTRVQLFTILKILGISWKEHSKMIWYFAEIPLVDFDLRYITLKRVDTYFYLYFYTYIKC